MIEEGTNQPGTLGYSYQVLARLLLTRLNWYEALDGQTLPPPPAITLQIDPAWLERHREIAEKGLEQAGGLGCMEISHHCRNVRISVDQSALLTAAKQAEVRTSGWPLGLVLDTPDDKPRAEKDGIAVEVRSPESLSGSTYDYWAVSNSGSFYALSSFQKDEDANRLFDANRTIARTAEASVHCANLYKALGVDLGAEIELNIRYRDLKGRRLKRQNTLSPSMTNRAEDYYSAQVRFRLSSLDAKLLELTISLCKGLFVLFDFASFTDPVYSTAVSRFLNNMPA